MGFRQLTMHVYTKLYVIHCIAMAHTGDAVDIYWIPLDPMVFIGLLIEPHGIPTVCHVDILESLVM